MLLALAGCETPVNNTDSDDTYAVSGTIALTGGAGTLTAVSVQLKKDGTATGEAVHPNTAGAYSIGGVADGEGYTIEAILTGYVTQATEAFAVAGGDVTGKNLTLTAVPPGSHAVTFEANGGTPVPANTSVPDGGTITAPEAMTKAGYVFDGWYTDDGTPDWGSKWNFATDTVSADVILYAKWRAPVLYTVTLSGNGLASDPDPLTQQTEGGIVTLPAMNNLPDELASAAFDGWNTKADGSGTKVLADQAYTPESSCTLYAQWDFLPSMGHKNNIKTMFSIENETELGVRAAFMAVHQALKTGKIAWFDLGVSYIDLVSLTVTADAGGGAINIPSKPLDLDDYHGNILRLIVVGKNSFKAGAHDGYVGGGEGSDDPHLVFQFQNVPGMHRMNAANDNTTGYEHSEMRTYINGNFYEGLKAAGVPDAVVWAPRRIVASRGNETPVAQIITDKLWLPTEYELFGSDTNVGNDYFKYNDYNNGPHAVTGVEMAANQAHLAYYTTGGTYTDWNARRIKYDSSNAIRHYFGASPHAGSTGYFCAVSTSGSSYGCGVAAAGGVAPAFCVR